MVVVKAAEIHQILTMTVEELSTEAVIGTEFHQWI